MGIVRRLLGQPEAVENLDLRRTVGGPIEGTNISLFNNVIPDWWAEMRGTSLVATPQLADKVWVANRCVQLNAQQIASMPLRFRAPASPTAQEPAWISSPDPNWYPNGIGDALHAIVAQMYGWGFACLHVTSRYADTMPRTWTVLDSGSVHIDTDSGRREYRYGNKDLSRADVVQIDRNPGIGKHGTPALRAYAQQAWGLLAAENQSMTVSQGGIPQFYFQPQKPMDKTQAETFQQQWMAATSRRNGAPPIVPKDIDAHQLSFNPSDLALLETQEWNSRLIATAYGVPSVILNMALQGGLTYQNPLALMQMWWLTELRTTAKRIGDAFTAQMLPRGQWVSFDASDITTGVINADDDEQGATAELGLQPSQVAAASPAQQPGRLTAIGGGG